MHRSLATLVLVFLIAFAIAATSSSAHTPATVRRDVVCNGIVGNSDMYGLGIRIGVYLQAFALLIAHYFEQPSFNNIRFSSFAFQLSMFVGVVYVTVSDPELEAAEAAIVVMFMLCSTTVIYKRRPQRLSWDKEWIVLFLEIFISIGISGYSVWFWFAGLDALKHSPDPCAGYAFLFAKVSMYGQFRMFMRFYTVYMMVAFAVGLYILVWSSSRKEQGVVQNDTPEDPEANKLPTTAATEPTDGKPVARPNKYVRMVSGFLPAIIFIFFVLAVELMIRWNNITGVGTVRSVGQLIPLFMGILSLFSIILDWEKPKKMPWQYVY
ncbi:hypothetical protein FN846DRAFT_957706 [Sphaerosporella brunnea]|uniref:Uncharacterized protein n=1 Tax=Sphaerosporella brunnea TaxID=1250544 RepID=A0A5J5ER14_9PEZI|nr:hypothetical protein FN846DRAFT_957706 [Sphaerosporella brunnea]